uniref:Uncharacterized protein n=1 Tax=Rhizophora mucronata TaxID=61149 RepID=A0A2P2IVW5_RHIMU
MIICCSLHRLQNPCLLLLHHPRFFINLL